MSDGDRIIEQLSKMSVQKKLNFLIGGQCAILSNSGVDIDKIIDILKTTPE